MKMRRTPGERTIALYQANNNRSLDAQRTGHGEDGMTGLSVPLPPHPPAWLVAIAIGAVVVTTLVVGLVRVVRHMMPQNSSDRLVWWHERRAFQELRRQHRQRGRTRKIPPQGTSL
jgi:hypothetical protein